MGRGILYLPALGRFLLSGLFVWAGYGDLSHHADSEQYFAGAGVPAPGLMVWVAALVEMVGGIAILIGFKTRWAAAVLGVWCLITGFGVHLPAEIGRASCRERV